MENKLYRTEGGSYRPALISLSVLYFMLGFATCLNDTLVPYFKKGFTLTYAEASLVQFYFFLTYGIVSIPASKIVERTGYQKGMVIGFIVAAAGALLFVPAAMLNLYFLFLAALFILAIGIVFMQVSANPYVVVLGSPATASSRLNLVQSVGSIGTIAAPIFGARFILPHLNDSAGAITAGHTGTMVTGHTGAVAAVRYPYIGLAIVLIVIAFIIGRLKLPSFTSGGHTSGDHTSAARTAAAHNSAAHNSADHADQKAAVDPGQRRSIFSFGNLRLGVWAIFLFVGTEVSVGSFLTNYIADTLKISEGHANGYVAFYWMGMLAGRLVGVFLMRFVRPPAMLIAAALGSITAIFVSVSASGQVAVWSMIGVGFFNSVMFGIIFSLAIEGLGNARTLASGILSTAISGGAFIALLQGAVRDHAGWGVAFMIPVLCYCYIIFYGIYISWNGYRGDLDKGLPDVGAWSR